VDEVFLQIKNGGNRHETMCREAQAWKDAQIKLASNEENAC
jgi:hypothetical protein